MSLDKAIYQLGRSTTNLLLPGSMEELGVGLMSAAPVMKLLQKGQNFCTAYKVLKEKTESLFPHERAVHSSLPASVGARENMGSSLPSAQVTKQIRSTRSSELTVSDILRAEELAETAYKQIRLNSKDVKVIAKNTGLNEFRIQRIKEHLFFKEHQLHYSVGRFDADPLIVESWKRLESGAFTDKDLHLLSHELFESKFEGIFKTDYLTSHNAASQAGYVSPIEGLDAEQISEIYNGLLHRFGQD